MAKRRLSLQQRRRIGTNRERALDRLGTDSPDNVGTERAGLVTARYGREVDVVDPEHPEQPRQRCYLRTHLEPVVGDRVLWHTGDRRGVITAVAPRRSVLRRRDNNQVRILAANIDQVGIVIAAEPEPHANLVDRFLAAAELEGMSALILVNKCDLDSESGQRAVAAICASHGALGYPVLKVSAHTGIGIDALRACLSGKVSIFCGQSGVGKSSLINRLFPGTGAAVGALSDSGAKGRHTTTTARFYPVPGGAVIDSPGIREFGVECPDPQRLMAGFIELAPLAMQCRFRDCAHRGDPGCAIAAAIHRGEVDPRRLASFHQLQTAP
jgi:ribosome biogenesis GTPase